MKHKKIVCLALALLMHCCPLLAQTDLLEEPVEEPAVKSFIATVADTVEQGTPFTVVYTLKAKGWGAGGRPLNGNGFVMQDVAYDQEVLRPYSTMQATVTYVTSLVGEQELPGMSIPVDSQLVFSDRKSVYVRPNNRYGLEMTTAHKWLVKEGHHPDSLCLTMEVEDNGFWLFVDRHNPCFCIIARQNVWSLLDKPVLAYSTDETIYLKGSRDNYNKMMQPYRQQIVALRHTVGRETVRETFKTKHRAVAPLLGRLEWGQAEPYNRASPVYNGRKTYVGCVPLATAMVMKYHQWPEEGHSQMYYRGDNNEVYRMDFSSFKPQWQSYKNQYKESDYTGSISNLAQMLTILGLSIDARFSNDYTAACLNNVKHILCNNLMYSGRMRFYYENLTDTRLAALIYEDLDHHRPCIVSNDHHAFVCDGYKDDYFHFNMGWYGSYNGYYRLNLGRFENTDEGRNHMFVQNVVCQIEPEKEDVHCEVTLEEAGTLDSLLSEELQQQVTTLVLSGPLNSADIRLLRKMAGASEGVSDGDWQGGALCVLDMENAYIIDDPEPYLTVKASGRWKRTRTIGSSKTEYSYDFDHMTASQWDSFCQNIGERQKGVFYTSTGNNRYWANYNCQSDVIGTRMFHDCSSLCSIILPQYTTKIDDFAFWGCSSLQTIRLPYTTEEVGRSPFSYCTSLERVELPRHAVVADATIEECSPVFRFTRY